MSRFRDWTTFVMAALALGSSAMTLKIVLADRNTARDNLATARLNHDTAEIQRANIVSQERMLDRLGIKVRP